MSSLSAIDTAPALMVRRSPISCAPSGCGERYRIAHSRPIARLKPQNSISPPIASATFSTDGSIASSIIFAAAHHRQVVLLHQPMDVVAIDPRLDGGARDVSLVTREELREVLA